MKELVGKKVKGFKFEDSEFSCGYSESMNKYINELGEITSINEQENVCEVLFNDGMTWNYPTKLIKKQLEPQYEVKMIVEAPKPKHYANGIDTFERMEANCTIDECLAFAKGNIDKYNFRKKGQDLEDYTKIIAYANWAIKLLNKK